MTNLLVNTINNDSTDEEIQKKFLNSCQNGNFELFQYIVDNYNDKLKLPTTYNFGWNDLDLVIDNYFTIICHYGHEKLLNYILDKLKITEGHLIFYGFRVACFNGQLNVLKVLLPLFDKPQLTTQSSIEGISYIQDSFQHILDIGLKFACINGHFELVKYFLTSPDLIIHSNIKYRQYEAFRDAAEGGYLNIVQYLLTSPELKTHAKINSYKDAALNSACHKGHLEVVEYLLTSPELTTHSNLNYPNQMALLCAGHNSHIQVIKFLLFSEKLEIHSDLHYKNNIFFRKAVKHNDFLLLEFLIYECNIQIDSYIEQSIKNKPHIKKMFTNRELNKILKLKLEDRKNNILKNLNKI